jgi:DNA repair protein RadC
MEKAVHEGHRERMRERISKAGIASLLPHEVLEYLLYAFVPRKDTNEIAHALISEFGSLSAVFNAEKEHLAQVAGMTENAALFLSSVPDILRLYAAETESVKLSLKGRGKAREYMKNMLYGANSEQIYAAALDSKEALIKCERLGVGTGDSVLLSVRKVVDFALKNKACGVILAHNHPSGNVKPSQADFALTREIVWTLHSVDCRLLDHYIFGASSYYSFEESGKLHVMLEEKDLSLKDGLIFYE